MARADAGSELYLHVVDWDRFQHYRDRDPKWIKVYMSLLRNDDYLGLSFHRRGILHGVWLLYAANKNLRLDTRTLSKHLWGRVTMADIDALVDGGWLVVLDHARAEAARPWASRYVSVENRMAILERDGKRCRQCGSTESLEIDHIVPISAGGTGEVGNLQVLCRKCNRTKRSRVDSVSDLSINSPAQSERERQRENEVLAAAAAEAPPKPTKQKPATERKPRPPDLLWDELVAIIGASPAGLERAKWNTAVKSLRESGATPDRLRAAATTYRRTYPDCALTPLALANNWTTLVSPTNGHAVESSEAFQARIRERERASSQLGWSIPVKGMDA